MYKRQHLAFALKALSMQGGGVVLDLCMCDVVRYAMGEITSDLPELAQEWNAIANENTDELYEMREPNGIARRLGEDNSKWL